MLKFVPVIARLLRLDRKRRPDKEPRGASWPKYPEEDERRRRDRSKGRRH